jgi:hypothetical protein
VLKSYPDSHADGNTNSYTNGDSQCDSDTNTYSDANTNCYADCYTYTYTYTYADAEGYAEAASHSATSTGGMNRLFRKGNAKSCGAPRTSDELGGKRRRNMKSRFRMLALL